MIILSIGEGVLIGFVLFGFLIFLALTTFRESQIQKQHREFRESVKDSLKGIYDELKLSNFLKIDFSEVHKNES